MKTRMIVSIKRRIYLSFLLLVCLFVMSGNRELILIQLQPLSDEDTLGKALITMGERRSKP